MTSGVVAFSAEGDPFALEIALVAFGVDPSGTNAVNDVGDERATERKPATEEEPEDERRFGRHLAAFLPAFTLAFAFAIAHGMPPWS